MTTQGPNQRRLSVEVQHASFVPATSAVGMLYLLLLQLRYRVLLQMEMVKGAE